METNSVVASNQNKSLAASGLAGLEFNPQDIVLPRILLMQGLSHFVSEGKAQFGDILESLGGDKLGDKNTPVEIIPLSKFKSITVLEKGTGNFVQNNPVPDSHQRPEFEMIYTGSNEKYDGKMVRNYLSYNFYVLIPKLLEEGMNMPALLSLRSTSAQAGKKLNTHFMTCAMSGLKPWHRTAKLTCSLDKNEQGQPYYVFDLAKGGKTSDDHAQMADLWAGILAKGSVKVDEEKPVAAPSPTGQF